MLKKLLLTLLAVPIILLAFVYIAPDQVFNLSQKLSQRMANWTIHSVTVNGEQLVYADNHNVGKPTIVFIHGFTGDKNNWLFVAQQLKSDYRTIAIDLLGHGESDKPLDGDYLVSRQAERVFGILEKIGVSEPVHVVGNSMGGQIAVFFAGRYPTVTRSLALLDNAGINLDTPILQNLMKDLRQGKMPLIPEKESDVDTIQSLVFHKPMPMLTPLKHAFIRPKIADKAVYWHVFNTGLFNGDLQKPAFREPIDIILPFLKVPTLIIWGKEDRVLDVASVAKMEQLFKPKKVLIYENVGHVPMLETPKQTAQDLDAFFRSVTNEPTSY